MHKATHQEIFLEYRDNCWEIKNKKVAPMGFKITSIGYHSSNPGPIFELPIRL